MQVTYEIAMAAGQDAARRNMRANNRTAMDEADADIWADTTNGLMFKVGLLTAEQYVELGGKI